MPPVNLVLELPAAIVCILVGEWLHLKDIMCLDTAICHSAHRLIFHESVLRSPQCVLVDAPGKFVIYNTSKSFQWFAMRSIRSEVLSLPYGGGPAVWENYLYSFGHHVKCVHFEGTAWEPDDFTRLARNCPNITSLVLGLCEIDEPLIEFLLSLTKVTTAHLRRCHTIYYVETVPVTQHLPIQNLTMNCATRIKTMFLNMCVPESLEKLILFQPISRDWCPFVNLRSLRLYVSTGRDWDLAIRMMQHCPMITNLNLAHSIFTDELIVEILSPLQQLRTLNIEKVKGLTDKGLVDVVWDHKHTLQGLYMQGCEGITSAGINCCLPGCEKLHTISCTCVYGICRNIMIYTTTLIIDKPDVPVVWGEISEHCRNVRYLYIEYPDEGDQSIDELITLACELPNLRKLVVTGLFDDSMFDKLKMEVNILKPGVQVSDKGADSKYDLFTLPI